MGGPLQRSGEPKLEPGLNCLICFVASCETNFYLRFGVWATPTPTSPLRDFIGTAPVRLADRLVAPDAKKSSP